MSVVQSKSGRAARFWRGVRRVAIAVGLVVVVCLTLLTSPLARDLRVAVVSDVLSRDASQPIFIEGDVRVRLFPELTLVATDVRVPSTYMDAVDFAHLETVRLAVAPLRYLTGGLLLPKVAASGLTVVLLRDEQGATSWIPSTETTSDGQNAGTFRFLGTRQIDFSDMRVNARDLETGFEFDFVLNTFQLAPSGGQEPGSQVISNGLVNDQRFDMSGTFPANGAFSLSGVLGESDFDLTGQGVTGGAPMDFDALLTLRSPDLEDVFETLRLQGRLEGRGEASTMLRYRNGFLNLDDITLSASLEKGQDFTLTGWLRDPRLGPEFDIRFRFDRFADGGAPDEAVFLRDVQLTGIDLHAIGDGSTIEVESVVVDTNAFDEELRNIGPFRVENIRRTEDGRLELRGLTLFLGPPDSPFLRLSGDVRNLLTFEGYTLSGALDLPAERVLPILPPDDAQKFGRIAGTLKVADVEGQAELQELTADTEDTDLWTLSVTANARDLTTLEDVTLDLRLGAADAATFLRAVALDPIDLGPFELFLNTQRRRSRFVAEAGGQFGGSRIDVDLDAQVRQSTPVLRGSVRSDRIRMTDLQKAIRTVVELAGALKAWEDLHTSDATRGTAALSEYKPLVITRETSDDQDDASDVKPPVVDASPAPDIDLSDFKPLVIEAGTDPTQALDDYKPLVLTDGAGDLSLEIFRDPERVLHILDAHIALDIAQLTGQAGLSKIQSDLIMRDGKLDFGPVSLTYGGGFFTLHAGLDVVRAPDWLRIKGRTSGWDIGDILQSLGMDIGAAGTLAAQFDLTGRHRPISAYPGTMRGQATVEMAEGRIDSSLIELSGLGVVPWLFSKELQQGWARVVCLRAPVSMTRGVIGIRDAVLETDRVQLVANGTIDIPGDRLDVRADPRPVGRPLARSAWPIAITGSLSNPSAGIAERRNWRMLQPLAIPENRRPCVPDAAQLQPADSGPR